MNVWETLVGVAVGLLLVWGLLIGVIWRLRPDELTLKGALRLLPDLLRMLKGIATDPTVPRGARVRLWLLLVYLALPIDLIPDFIPVIGYADDAVITVAALRSVVRHAGSDVVTRHWPGSPEGLAAVARLAGLGDLDDRGDLGDRGDPGDLDDRGELGDRGDLDDPTPTRRPL